MVSGVTGMRAIAAFGRAQAITLVPGRNGNASMGAPGIEMPSCASVASRLFASPGILAVDSQQSEGNSGVAGFV